MVLQFPCFVYSSGIAFVMLIECVVCMMCSMLIEYIILCVYAVCLCSNA